MHCAFLLSLRLAPSSSSPSQIHQEDQRQRQRGTLARAGLHHHEEPAPQPALPGGAHALGAADEHARGPPGGCW